MVGMGGIEPPATSLSVKCSTAELHAPFRYHKCSCLYTQELSDSLLVKYFLKFLREICGVPNERIKISLRFFKHQNVRKLTDYWSEETDVLRNNFRTMLVTASRSSLHIKPFNRLSYGVVQVVVADTKLFHRIMGYIEGLKKFV